MSRINLYRELNKSNKQWILSVKKQENRLHNIWIGNSCDPFTSPSSVISPHFQMRFIFMFLDFDLVGEKIPPRNLYFYENSFILTFRHSP